MERTRPSRSAVTEHRGERETESPEPASPTPQPRPARPTVAPLPAAAIPFPAATRINPSSTTIIRRSPDGDEDEEHGLYDDFVEEKWDDIEPSTRTGTRTVGPKWRSKRRERERRANWKARGAERSRDKRKQERRRARDRKYQADDSGPDPWSRIATEQRERQERERKEAEERERQERERQERERKEAEERKRQEAERLRQEEEERQRRKAEEERQAEEDSLKNWATTSADPELFKSRAKRHLARLRQELSNVPPEKQPFVRSSLDDAEKKIKNAKGERTQKDAIEALTKGAERLRAEMVDVISPHRAAARVKVQEAKNEADRLLAEQKASGPERDLAASLAKKARALASDASAETMMRTPTEINKVERAADALIVEVTAARADIRLFHFVTGTFSERQHQLDLLRRGGLSETQISTYMPLVPAAGGTRRGEQLVALVKVAQEPDAIGLAGLAQVLPIPSVDADHLVHVVVLAKVMRLTVPVITGNYVLLQNVASKFSRPGLTWFTGFTLVQVNNLVAACDPTRLAEFSKKVRGVKILWFLGHPTNALTPAQLLQYEANPEILDGFNGMTDGGWSHVVSDTHYDPAMNTISGGHDESAFNHICLNPPDRVTTCSRTLRASAAGGNVKKYDYTLTNLDGKTTTSVKTVITQLRANEQAWRQSADRAAWDALRRGRFWADGNWSGRDGATFWKGKHKDGFITTAYPDI